MATTNITLQKIRRLYTTSRKNATARISHSSAYEDLTPEILCYPFFDLISFLHDYYIPFIVVVGIFCNILNFYVFLNSHLKHRSSSYYLAALAISDVGFLVSLGMIWIGDTFGVQTFNRNGWCQFVVYLSSTSSFLSVWLIVAFTVERFIAVQYPLQRPHVCTVARAKSVVLALTLLALLLNAYVLVTAGVETKHDGTDACDMRVEYSEVMSVITLIDSLVTLAIPSVLLVFMNALITRKLIRFNHRFHEDDHNDESTAETNTSIPLDNIRRHLGSQHSLHSVKTNNSRLTAIRTANDMSQSSNQQRFSPHSNVVSVRTQRSITKMLLVISTTFLVLNMPSYVTRFYIIYQSFWGKSAPAVLYCVQQFCMILYYTNFSINFILYSLCGSTFRRCILQILRRKICACSLPKCLDRN